MDDDTPLLSRPQRRLLRRIFNGRTVPLEVDGRPFLTFKEASRHLQALDVEARDAAYATFKALALAQSPQNREAEVPPPALDQPEEECP